jgi:hypothetical protein
MPLTLNIPRIVDGNEYPYVTANLAISPLVEETNIGGSCAIVFKPYRVLGDETFEFLNDPIQLVYLDVFVSAETDPALGLALMTIFGSLQQFITDKNL